MPDFHKCPGRTREADWRTRDGQEIAHCGATSAALGFGHSVSEGVCRECAAAGPAEMSNPVFARLVRGRLRARVWASPRAIYPAHATRETAFHQLVAEIGIGREEARDILREAVRRGMDPDRAADLADAEGVGDPA